MRAEEMIQMLRRRPFSPIRVRLTDGRTYDIYHPDQVIVLKQSLDIGVASDPATGIAERVDRCSLLHVVRVEEIPTSATSTGSQN